MRGWRQLRRARAVHAGRAAPARRSPRALLAGVAAAWTSTGSTSSASSTSTSARPRRTSTGCSRAPRSSTSSLLLDEGDALLTQRTDVQTSNDRYANLETNFLLQRLESLRGHPGRHDQRRRADRRRVPAPDGRRRRLPAARRARALDDLAAAPAGATTTSSTALLDELAARCALTGGQIRNAVLHASLLALDGGRTDRTPSTSRPRCGASTARPAQVCPLRRRRCALAEPAVALRRAGRARARRAGRARRAPPGADAARPPGIPPRRRPRCALGRRPPASRCRAAVAEPLAARASASTSRGVRVHTDAAGGERRRGALRRARVHARPPHLPRPRRAADRPAR